MPRKQSRKKPKVRPEVLGEALHLAILTGFRTDLHRAGRGYRFDLVNHKEVFMESDPFTYLDVFHPRFVAPVALVVHGSHVCVRDRKFDLGEPGVEKKVVQAVIDYFDNCINKIEEAAAS